jgi:hypothetical protein
MAVATIDDFLAVVSHLAWMFGGGQGGCFSCWNATMYNWHCAGLLQVSGSVDWWWGVELFRMGCIGTT